MVSAIATGSAGQLRPGRIDDFRPGDAAIDVNFDARCTMVEAAHEERKKKERKKRKKERKGRRRRRNIILLYITPNK